MPSRGVRASVRASLLGVFVVCIGLVVGADALGHGAASTEFRSTVEAIEPDGLPITAEVKSGDDRLRVTNTGDEDLVVFGYEDDDPYLRIGPDGVFVNRNSGAYYTNQERYGSTKVPDGIGEGPPKWHREPGDLPAYEFHDHRIHWMLRSLPPGVDDGDDAPQRVFGWTIPIRYGDRDGEIRGTLEYVGGGSSIGQLLGGIGVALAVVAISLVVIVRVRRDSKRGR